MTDFPTDAHFEALATRVLDRTLPHAEWTHEAHFAFALWMLRHRPDRSNPEAFRTIIVALNEAHGTPNTDTSGYHHTITIASLGAAGFVLGLREADRPLAAALAELMVGPYGRSDWILAHWSREQLFSPEARREWCEPDLEPLPWRGPPLPVS